MAGIGKTSQCDRILAYISDFGSITTRDAIYELKKRGFKIESERQTTLDKYGERVCFTRYIIKSESKRGTYAHI